ncbi:MAG: hypothetical protein QOJ31_129 [Gaiellales bacterium]|jgi:uncharacterized protein with FMN-binding domain|nr:hypothetical protein [Gaiellales bacterium]
MGRAAYVIGGTVLGAAAVMAIPTPGKPQQVALAGNAGATTQGSAKAGSSSTTSPPATTSSGGSSSSAKPTSATKTVTGSIVTNQYSRLQVSLQIKNGRISHVGFTTFTANDSKSVGIDQQAVPILIQETISAQSAQIQGVSGATYTTTAYEQSLQAAIDKAGLPG